MTVKISARYDGNLISASGGDRYLLFTVTGEGDTTTPRVPLNLSLILDRSGSMSSENKLELVKRAAAFVVERLSEHDRVNVIAYDDEVRVLAKSCQVTPQNRNRIKDEIKKLHTGGSTNLSEGWLTGCREIAEFQSEKNYIDCAWLLTDGLANVGIVDQEELTTHAAELRKRGISTTTFGVGYDFNEDLLRAMSEKGGGHFYFIDSGKQIKNYFEGELGERLNTVARSLALEIRLPEGVSLDCLNDYEKTASADRVILHLGDIFTGEVKQVMVKLTLPEGKIGRQVKPDAVLMYTDATDGSGHEIRLADKLAITYSSAEESKSQKIPADFQEILGQLLAARAKQEILRANRTGDYQAVRNTTAAFRMATQALGLEESLQVQRELSEVENLNIQAAQAPLPAAFAKQTQYTAHMKQRSRRDYKKEDEE